MKESRLEQKLRLAISAAGGYTVKLNAAWAIGIPDRLVILPAGRVIFVELKTHPSAFISQTQKWWGKTLSGLGHEYALVASGDDIGALLGDTLAVGPRDHLS